MIYSDSDMPIGNGMYIYHSFKSVLLTFQRSYRIWATIGNVSKLITVCKFQLTRAALSLLPSAKQFS